MEIWTNNKYPSTAAIRPVLFYTVIDGNGYFSSDGGTVVLVKFRGHLFGITCRHVLNGRPPGDLVTHHYLSEETALKPRITALLTGTGGTPSRPEIEDILIVSWNKEHIPIGLDAVVIDRPVEPESGDRLAIAGFLKDRSEFSDPRGKAFCFETEAVDLGTDIFDSDLRLARVLFEDNEQERSSGLSGGLVFNLTKQVPAGLITRATDIREDFRLRYIPFTLIEPALRVFSKQMEWHWNQIVFNFTVRK